MVQLDGGCREGDVITLVDDGTRVNNIRGIAIHIADGLRHEGISGALVEKLEAQLETSCKETGLKTRIGGMGLFPLQIWVGKVFRRRHHLTIVSIHRSLLDDHHRGLVVQHITLFTIGRLHRQIVQPIDIKLRNALQIGIS